MTDDIADYERKAWRALADAFIIRVLDDNRSRAAIVRITCAAWLVTLALSWRAYIDNLRIFALSPVIEILGRTPVWADWLALVLNVGFLGWLLLQPLRRGPAFGALACTGFWVLQDLLRFQPYTYMYFLRSCWRCFVHQPASMP